MIYFWLFYFLLSLFISYLLSLLFDRNILKVSAFSISLSLLGAIWFKIPGENMIAPIISIFLLESTILENNGFQRILRPLSLFSFLIIISTLLLFKKKSKN